MWSFAVRSLSCDNTEEGRGINFPLPLSGLDAGRRGSGSLSGLGRLEARGSGTALMVIDYANEAAWGMQMGGSGRDSLAACSHLLAPRFMAELGLCEAPQHIHGVLKKLCGQNPDEVIAKQTRFFQAPANAPHSTASFLASFLQRSGG